MQIDQMEKRSPINKKSWTSVGASIRLNEVDLFNKQLDNLQCQTLKDLCNLLIAGKLRRVTDDEQVHIMKVQTQATGLSTVQNGDKFDFWKQIDDEDFHKWLLGKYIPHTANCYHSYYVRYVDIFFGPNAESELLKLAKHKLSWILQSIKRFGDYYSNRYGNKEVKFLIARIIERYDLNKDLDQKDHIYLVSPQFVEDKINNVMNIPGDIGFTCRLGLFSGLREGEIIYIKQKQICLQSFGCQCDNLHVANSKNGLSVIAINWTRGNKKALATIIPTCYWQKLRNMSKFDEHDIQAAHKILKREAGIAYVVLRKIHYNVMRFNNAFELDEAEVLAGRFRSVSARHYVLNDPDKLSGKYVSALQNFGVNLDSQI
jgi:hypothetical protein